MPQLTLWSFVAYFLRLGSLGILAGVIGLLAYQVAAAMADALRMTA